MRGITLSDLQEQRNRLKAATAALASQHYIGELDQAIMKLQDAFAYFEKHGQLDSGEQRVEVYRSARAVEEKQEHGDDVKHARMIIALSGLRLLQQSIPRVKEMADRCLELAGKDAVRVACAPIQREGGKPLPSEFTLPEGYEPVSLSSVARTVGAAAGIAVAQKIKTLVGM